MKKDIVLEIFHSVLFWGLLLQIVMAVLNATHIINIRWIIILIPLWIMLLSTLFVFIRESLGLFKYIIESFRETFKK